MPLSRQSERYAREGAKLSVSTLADQVGACAFAPQPLHELIAAHVEPQRDPLQPSGTSRLHDVVLAPGGLDPRAEACRVSVP